MERSVKCIRNLTKVFLQISNYNVGMSNKNNCKTIVTVNLRFSTLRSRFERSLKEKAKAFFEKF